MLLAGRSVQVLMTPASCVEVHSHSISRPSRPRRTILVVRDIVSYVAFLSVFTVVLQSNQIATACVSHPHRTRITHHTLPHTQGTHTPLK